MFLDPGLRTRDLLAYSCKRRHFCPSCHQNRVVEFGEWLCTQVLKQVPHRQWVFSLLSVPSPKPMSMSQKN
ncbi:MAG: transposase zinc-binding domain-containing protein [Desulfobacteraceae bacterium]